MAERNTPFGIMQHLDIQVCENAVGAVHQGHVYTEPEYTKVEIIRAVIVKNGTMFHRPTVDIVLHDEQGNKYVMIITGALLSSLTAML